VGANVSNTVCRLCKVVLTPHHLRAKHDVVLMETDAFEWLPGLGAFVEGYSLIVSKRHVPNTGCLDDSSIAELERFVTEVKHILRAIYAAGTIVFEHGSVGVRQKAGCCIEHHHLHILPFDLPAIPSHMRRVMPTSKPVNSFGALRDYQAAGKPFIYYETAEGSAFVFDAPMDLPGQFMRQVLAVECGCPSDWEWTENPFLERVSSFVDKVISFLRRQGSTS
jgi:ATP adenylyltransferase